MKKSFTPILAAALSVPVLVAAFSVTWLISALPARAATKPKPMSKEVSEAFEATSVKARLIDKLGADALGISVSVSEKTATLSGEVMKSASQGLAEQVALSVKGIKKVDNQVEVKEPAGPVAASEASVKNVALEMKVKSVLLTKIGTDALKIEVEAVDGVVSLRGKLDNSASSKVAIQKTRSIKGVRKVVDLLG